MRYEDSVWAAEQSWKIHALSSISSLIAVAMSVSLLYYVSIKVFPLEEDNMYTHSSSSSPRGQLTKDYKAISDAYANTIIDQKEQIRLLTIKVNKLQQAKGKSL